MPYNFDDFITKAFADDKTTDLSMYKDPQFCKDLQVYALEKIKYLLCTALEAHLHHAGKQELFYLSEVINKTDHLGLNILDYCAVAGLDNFATMVATLGGEESKKLENFKLKIAGQFVADERLALIEKIRKVLENIAHGKLQHIKMPLGKRIKRSLWQEFKYRLKQNVFGTHKIATFLLLFGIACVIAAPFTAGLSTILLLALGLPALFAALNSLQAASAETLRFEQMEDQTRMSEEAHMLRMLVKIVLDDAHNLMDKPLSSEPIHAHFNTTLNQTTIEGMTFYLEGLTERGAAERELKEQLVRLTRSATI